MLKVAHKAKKIGLMGIVSTYAGGNAVQKGMKEEEAVKEIVEMHLKKIKVFFVYDFNIVLFRCIKEKKKKKINCFMVLIR